jgi:hypothetical protein
VAVKDAYLAGGCIPKTPGDGRGSTPEEEGQRILFDFMGNLDFLLALVDEVAIDTATRGAFKEDTTFRGLRDVIKKCNRVLESMLVKRERKVERALGGVTEGGEDSSRRQTESDDVSVGSEFSSVSTASSRSSVI